MSPSNIKVFDRKLVDCHRIRAEKMSGDFSFLIDHCKQNLNDRINDIKRDFSKKIDLKKHFYNLSEYEDINLSEKKPDLVISHLDLHWVNDLPGLLLQIKDNLQPDGVFLACLFGGETLYELRHTLMEIEIEMFGGVSPRVSPFVDMRDMGALLQRAGFALPVTDHEVIRVTYDHVFDLINDLRGMGQTNAVINRSKKYLGKEFWSRVQQFYKNNFSNEHGRLQASFEVIYLIGWSPAASQPQPLKPGSAKQSLAQVLKTREIKLPEKARPHK